MSQDLILHGAGSPPLSQHLTSRNEFRQTGVWSWSDLLSKAVRGSAAVLSRFSEGGIDPFTTIIGQMICREFKLGHDGAKLFLDILDSLKCNSTVGDVMHFGFGIDSIVRNLSATYEGGILVILCAALSECYYEHHAAKILFQLVQEYKPKDSSDHTPSPIQWLSLVRQCAGVLAADEFPVIAEHFMHLHPQNLLGGQQLQVSLLGRHPRRRGISSPESIAEAILAVGKVSTGQLETITITGTADAGWLAAVAHRFFNLRLSIFGPEGELLYKNFQPNERAQIKILYELASREGISKEMEISGKLYSLRDISEILVRKDGEYGSALLFGRLPWESALSLTFGSRYHRLTESVNFGRALGAAARIFDLIHRLDRRIYEEIVMQESHYCSSGRGQGFISHAIMRFPELLPHKLNMENIPNVSFGETNGLYDSCLSNLQRSCSCPVCESTASRQEIQEQGFCLVVLTEAIIVLLRDLPAITVPEGLRPTRAGIQWYYVRQLDIRLGEAGVTQSIRSTHGQMAFILDNVPDRNIKEDKVAIRQLTKATRLFTGREAQYTTYDLSAVSMAGICVFLDLFTDITCHPETLGRCTVIPGKIEMAGRSYDIVEDMSDFHGYGPYSVRSEAPERLSSPSELRAGYDSASFVAQPAIGRLQVGLLAKHRSSGSVLLGPAMLTRHLLRAFGRVHCPHTSNEWSQIRLSADDCVSQVNEDDGHPIWEFEGCLISKMVAMVRAYDGPVDYYMIWRYDECKQCCRKAASSEKPTLIFF